MKHARQKIREAVATIIAGVGTVYRSRAYPMIQLPVLSVYANNERSEMENDNYAAPRRYTRRLELYIEVAVEATTNHDDLADDYAAQVEALMAADLTLAGSATDSELVGSNVSISGEAEKPIAITRLVYEVWYRTTGADPENPL